MTAIAADQVSASGVAGTEPSIFVPSGTPPSSLEAADLIVGTGQAVTASDTVTVQYAGCSWTKQALFDASWTRGQAASFPLSGVIKGWSEGLVGMKVGGRRELLIPPDLAYGASPPSPQIAANDTLLFVVDLVKIG